VSASTIPWEGTVLSFGLNSEILPAVITSVVVLVSNIFAVALPDFAGFHHLGPSSVTLCATLLLFGFAIVLSLCGSSTGGRH
jgi:hypothetical protein